jgi:Protein of unknown function (DUF3137)
MKDNNDKLYNLYLELKPTIAELEEERKSALVKILLLDGIITLILIFLFIKFLILTEFIIPFAIYFLTAAIFLITFMFYGLHALLLGKKYAQIFKETIIKPVIQLFKIANYNSKGLIDFSSVKNSLIFKSLNKYKKASSSYQGNDCVQYNGKDLISNSNMQCSQVQINGNDQNIFKGLFIIVDLPKNTNTAFGTSNNISNNKILLDNTEFNELFPVYAENTTEAFYVLPSNLLERMVNFVRKTGRKFDFSVVDNKFYIAIPYNRELLEPPIFKSLFDYSIYEEYLTDLELAIGIVEDLKLA